MSNTPNGRKTKESTSRAPAAPRGAQADQDALRTGIRLGYLIHDVSRMRRTAFDHLMKPLGVTRAQWWVLAHLSRQDGMAQTQLAAILDVGKASLGSLLDRLEATGFIERRPDAVDRRVKRVFLSRSSRQLLEELSEVEARFNEQILSGLSAEDRKSLIRMLTLIKNALSDLPLDELSETMAQETSAVE
ncbi:transcriptional regulator, MarR family [Castellaniella defragrans 65Phen]|uniref:Transcriptional regulator, MarR family n=2 Tax=Castellaniella defragrans TaxID=75697 RepID=W8X541_CASD6|nr:MarR family transcriptional regulator [Castellaniella defragrans]KAB0622745.1 MarR family transcriptional regulator [Castellaniella defragrans]MBB6085238.1 DNA-binding MarR family transcriptional regulator [Castellaniella defragrans]CDM25292.1 transcriptional regulator, MarR family [Castellaniella defragrans 65Phen]